MKKYFVIIILILVAVFFSGCMQFSNNADTADKLATLNQNNQTSDDFLPQQDIADSDEGESVPVIETPEIIDNGTALEEGNIPEALEDSSEEDTALPATGSGNTISNNVTSTEELTNETVEDIQAEEEQSISTGLFPQESPPVEETQINDSNLPLTANLTLKERITSFIYQLQHVEFEELLSQNVSLIVVEPEELDETQVAALKNSNKIVLSYLSIGEAEKWRDYWQDKWDANQPSWVGENQSGEQSPVVKYWEQEWQELTFSRMDEIVLLGFDGFVLDTVSTGYHYWEKKGYDKTFTRNEMAEFVKRISARAKNTSKLVFVNNAGSLLDKEGYLDAIDGMTSEEAFYYDDEPASWSGGDVALLDKVIAAGKPVLAIDYSTKKELQCDFIKKAKEHGFVPFVTTKGLDTIMQIEC